MKEVKRGEGIEYSIISCSDRCNDCLFKCEVLVDEIKQINISCRHPKGPGNPVHCIYFKNREIS